MRTTFIFSAAASFSDSEIRRIFQSLRFRNWSFHHHLYRRFRRSPMQSPTPSKYMTDLNQTDPHTGQTSPHTDSSGRTNLALKGPQTGPDLTVQEPPTFEVINKYEHVQVGPLYSFPLPELHHG